MDRISARATPQAIAKIAAAERDRYISDEVVANLYLKVTPGGSRSWYWITKLRTAGRPSRKLSIGKFPAVGLADARVKAGEWNIARDRGDDPQLTLKIAVMAADMIRVQREVTDLNTVEAVWNRYIALKESAKSVPEKKRLMKVNFLNLHGSKPITDLTAEHITDALAVVEERGAHATANRLLSEIKPFLAWAANPKRKLNIRNVAADIQKEHAAEGQNPRRALMLWEIATLWRATDTFDADDRDFFRLLILTGCRRSEASGAKYSELHGHIWQTPRERAKTNVTYKLPLTGRSLAIFAARKDQKRDLLFLDSWHKAAFKRALERLRKRADEVAGKPLASWDLHGIRHGFRTEAVQHGCTDPHTAEKIINHSAQRYDHGEYLPQKLSALEKWEALIMAEVQRQTDEAAAKST